MLGWYCNLFEEKRVVSNVELHGIFPSFHNRNEEKDRQGELTRSGVCLTWVQTPAVVVSNFINIVVAEDVDGTGNGCCIRRDSTARIQRV